MTGIWASLITVLLLLGSAWGQSLQETTEWMRTFASAHSRWQWGGARNSNELQFSGCIVKQIIYQDGKPMNGSLDASTATYSLADLDPKSVKLYPNPSSASVSVGFETINSENKIIIGEAKSCKYTLCVNEWVIAFDEEASALRFAKAMGHAITVCGGRGSVF